LSGFLAGAGVLLAATAGAAAIVLPPGRPRALAMLAALVLFPALILGDQWHTTQIEALRTDEPRVALLALAGIAIVATLAFALHRWPILVPLAIVAALPFRIPLESGGETANLLVPLYLVIAGAVAATLWSRWKSPAARELHRLPQILAAILLLYAVQTLYSEDFSTGLQSVCFFFAPFAVVYALISEVRWDRRTLVLTLIVLGVEATAFVILGTVESLTRELLWNDAVIRSNEFHTYFRVNSVFWDPNIYGRYLALTIVVATAALLWVRRRLDFALLVALVAILWLGLAQTFSESSFIALLAGLAMLAALRWSWRWALAATVCGVIGVVVVVLFAGGKGTINLNVLTSGRADLVEGGLELWTERPLWGYGSGGFQEAYRDHRDNENKPVSESHTEPVTVLAEQGLIGFALYVALIVAALWVMASGIRGPPASAGRAAVLAAFVALLVHTMAYAGFYEDPITWVLLAAGVSLAAPAVRERT
jgi:putative inorganic carbon (HCO3(-)) transporter